AQGCEPDIAMPGASVTENLKRQADARGLLRRRKIAALILTHLPNIRYLTGFSGSTALALLTGDACTLLLDPRYRDSGVLETQGAATVVAAGDAWQTLAGLIRSRRLRRVGFEPGAVRYDQFQRLQSLSPAVSLIPLDGIIECLRKIKSPSEVAAIGRAL